MAQDADGEAHVVIFRDYDPVNAEMLLEMLQNNGFAARLLGTRSGPSIGVPQLAFEVLIEVPASQSAEAAEFIRAFRSPQPLAEDEPADE
jgi:hypothetical protein